jgi:hypothetical protein
MSVILLPTLAGGGVTDADRVFWGHFVEGLPDGSQLIDAGSNRQDSPGEGVLLSAALEHAEAPVVLVVPAGAPWRRADLVSGLGARIDRAHMVVACRPESPRSLGARLLHGLVRAVARVVLAIDIGPVSGWPGWRRWLERQAGWWLFGVRGTDPFSPCRMFRREIGRLAALQSRGAMVHGELSAKANFLGALIDEEPPSWSLPPRDSSADPLWWPDFRLVWGDPRFAGPLSASPDAVNDRVP